MSDTRHVELLHRAARLFTQARRELIERAEALDTEVVRHDRRSGHVYWFNRNNDAMSRAIACGYWDKVPR